MRLEGIHHITAITGDAPRNVDFYTRVMGLRLVAKTVNQDDPSVYHLFYASETGRPGSELTFFEYPGAVPGRDGSGMVHRIVSRVGTPEALDFWSGRLGDEGMSGRVLERVLGARPAADSTWELRGQRRGAVLAYDPPPQQPGYQSAGTVHHVAWGTTAQEHPRWLDRLRDAGVPSTPIIDRYYFHSIYFREPSGVLFEIADDAPGFTVDGPVEELGSRIILPPFLEDRRAEIEARLTPLPDPRAAQRAPSA